jgi:pimeloyl-ACP methyl ester carboxylesterase
MFEFVNRGYGKKLFIIGGWAFDRRVFAQLNLPYDYFFYDGAAAEAIGELEEFLEKEKNKTEKISLLGFSAGAFAVCEFAGRCTEVVDEVILVGLRRRYDRQNLEKIKELLRRNRRAYLQGFYRQCFCRAELYQWFKETLLKDYLEKMSLEKLVGDLDWLGSVEIDADNLKEIKSVMIIHGSADKIAPLAQTEKIAESLPRARLVVFEKMGHLPFLHKDFEKRFYE